MQHNKVYLTLAQSRAWGTEWPIGDPHAFGKREMPVIAVAAAIGSAVAGVGMIGATAGILGTAVIGSITLGTVLGGAMLVGGVMSLVGTVTGNEKLSKIGGILSMVGGIGGFAAGATSAAANGAGFIDSVKAGMSTVSGAFNDGAKALGLDFLATGSTTNQAAPIVESSTPVPVEGVTGAADAAAAPALSTQSSALGGQAAPALQSGVSNGAPITDLSTQAQAADATRIASTAAAPAASGGGTGLLNSQGFWSAAQGLGSGLTGDAEAEALEKKTALEREQWNTQQANAKAQVFMFDPNNPAQVAQAQQYAAQGIPVQPIGVTPGMTVQPIRTTAPAPIYSLPPAAPAAPTV